MKGYIKIYRELLEKPIWFKSTPEQKAILITLLLMANHKENSWEWQAEKFTVKPGQFVTSLENIAQKAGKGVSIQNVRTALNRFEKPYEFLTNKSTKTGRLITIINWELYQLEEIDLTKTPTDNQQRPNKDLTPNKNDKNEKNIIIDQFFEECWQLYPRKEGKSKIKPSRKKELFKLGDEIKRAIERYKEKTKDTDRQYIQQGGTFFNGGYIDYLDSNYQVPDKKYITQPSTRYKDMSDYDPAE